MTSACSLFTSGLCMPSGGRGVCEEVGVYVRGGGGVSICGGRRRCGYMREGVCE